jgi:hypothetical protein
VFFNEDNNESPLLLHRISVVIVGAMVALGFICGGIAWLYDTALTPTIIENQWINSQKLNAASTSPMLDDSTIVSLERTQCFGECPAYKVSVYGSGRVEFRGEAFVCNTEPPPVKVDSELVKRLVAGLVSLNYFELPNYIAQNATDDFTAIVTLTYSGQSHVVEHYHGDYSAPRLLGWIEDRIDAVAGTAAWIGTYDIHGAKVCVLPDGTRKTINFPFS